jgi:fibronectin type 3 domain-containing protein
MRSGKMRKLEFFALGILFLGALGAFFSFRHRSHIHSVTLTWRAAIESPGDKVVSYKIYRSTAHGGPYAALASGLKTLSYHDELVVPGTTYYYVVTSVGQSGHESRPSDEVQVTVPDR